MNEVSPENIALRVLYLSPQESARHDDFWHAYDALNQSEKPSMRFLKLMEYIADERGMYRLTRTGKAVAIKTEPTPGLDERIMDEVTSFSNIPNKPLWADVLGFFIGLY